MFSKYMLLACSPFVNADPAELSIAAGKFWLAIRHLLILQEIYGRIFLPPYAFLQ